MRTTPLLQTLIILVAALMTFGNIAAEWAVAPPVHAGLAASPAPPTVTTSHASASSTPVGRVRFPL